MTETLQGRKVAILAADGVERVELEKPREALERAGAQTEVLSIHDGEIQARENDLNAAGTFTVDQDVVVDGNLITSRSPEDLPAFSEAIVSQLAGTTTKEEEKS
ncbi:DJ-1/PfpI family protein [Gulosibacter sediminis]|uniref:DJ-1/PfpI family protein n=1 Tax=Gulosibacter sediminis TaxID=1729695 RepID=UPI0024A905B2|nr:DJ-1/PfpI family protein [Gulosibacter sediminis]